MTTYNYPGPQPKPKRTGLWIGLTLAVGVVIFVMLACAGALGAFSAEPQADTDSPVLVPIPASKGPAKASQKPAAASIGEGMWLVGTDVGSGTYKTAGADDSAIPFCIWAVWHNEDQESVVTSGSSDKANKPGRVTLKKGQMFETSGCQKWVKVS